MSKRILSLSPSLRYLAYACFEGRALLDWGIKGSLKGLQTQSRITRKLELAEQLARQYEPHVVLLPAGDDSRKPNLKRLASALTTLLSVQVDAVVTFPKDDVLAYFRGLTIAERPTKQLIMAAVGRMFPELKRYIPKPRRPWESQDYWLPMFDAVAQGAAWLNRSK